MEAGRNPRDGEVYSGPLADGGLNLVRSPVLGELYREPLGIDCSLILAEAYVIYWQRGPEMRFGGILGVDFDIEMAANCDTAENEMLGEDRFR
jgi:hypothetical protein